MKIARIIEGIIGMPLKLGFTLPEMGLSGGDVSRQWPTHQNALFVWTFAGWLDIIYKISRIHPEFLKEQLRL